MDFIESRRWKVTLIVLSSIAVVMFIVSRIMLNNYITMAIYLIVHLYQFGGIITSYLAVEFNNYFSVDSTKCIEIVFFMFFATPYSCILFIINTTNSDYRDNEESPF